MSLTVVLTCVPGGGGYGRGGYLRRRSQGRRGLTTRADHNGIGFGGLEQTGRAPPTQVNDAERHRGRPRRTSKPASELVPQERDHALRTRPISVRFEPGGTLTGRQTAVPLVRLLLAACQARAV